MGGGRGKPMLIFTSAIVGRGTTIANAKRIVPKSSFFILLPPFCFHQETTFVRMVGQPGLTSCF
jgi:hypothetical protein